MRIFLTILSTLFSIVLFGQYTNWIYSTTIQLQDPNGKERDDYPVFLEVNTSDWINSGFIKNDASDLRFAYDCLGEEPVPYWIESGLNTPSTSIWVRVNNLPADGQLNLYVFGGNPAAISESNFNAVFKKSLRLPTGNPLLDEISPRNPFFHKLDPNLDSVLSEHVVNTDSTYCIETWVMDSVEWLEIAPGFTWAVNKDYCGDFNEVEAVRDSFIHRLIIKNVRKTIIEGVIDISGMGWDGGFVLNKGQRPDGEFRDKYYHGFNIGGGWGIGGADKAFFNSDGGNVNGRGCGGGSYGCEGGVGTYAGVREFEAEQYQNPYGTISFDSIFPGSGGGGVDVTEINGAWPGGNGGGGIYLQSDFFTSIGGRILANGENGKGLPYDPMAPIGIGGGGGSGGGILVKSRDFENVLLLQAIGGDGGSHSLAGGGGGGGRIKIFAKRANPVNFIPDVRGGAAGSRLPGAGGVVEREAEPGCQGSYYFGNIDYDEEANQIVGQWIPRTVTISADKSEACRGEEITFSVNQGFAQYIFVRNSDTISIQDSTLFRFSDFQPGDVIYVIGEQIPGCGLNSNVLALNIKDAPDIPIDDQGPFCTSDAVVNLQEPNGLTGTWNGPGVINSPDGIIDPSLINQGSYRYGFRAPVPGELCLGVGFIDIDFNEPNSAFDLPTQVCENEGLIDIIPNTAGGEFSGNGVIDPSGVFDPTLVALGQTDITYEITDAQGCFGTSFRRIKVVGSPQAGITVDREQCPNQVFNIQGAGGDFYNWEPAESIVITGNRVKDIKANLKETTDFTLVVKNEVGCSDTAITTINVLPEFSISAGPDLVICKDEPKQLKVNGAISYEWFPSDYLSNAVISNPVCTPLTNIFYRITGTNSAGCKTEDTLRIQIIDPDKFDTEISTDQVCALDTIFVVSENCEKSYIIGAPAIAVNEDSLEWMVIPDSELITEFTVARVSGDCFSEEKFPITVSPAPVYPLDVEYIMCLSDSIIFDKQFTGGNNINFDFSPITNFSDIDVLPTIFKSRFPGTVNIELNSENEFGCTNTQTAVVNINPTPIAQIDPSITKCSEDTVQLNAIVSNGNPEILWSPSVGLSSSTIRNPKVFVGQTQKYVLRVKGGEGCEARDTINVIVNPGPNLQVVENIPYCPGDTGYVEITGANSYIWSDDAMVSSKFSPQVEVYEPNSGIIKVSGVEGQFGCKTTLDIPITVFPPALVELGDSITICAKDTITILGQGISFNNSVNWLPQSVIDVQTFNTIEAYPQVSQYIHSHVTTQNGCTEEDSVFVEVNPLPITNNLTPSEFVCVNDTLSLSFSSNEFSYNWEPNQYISSNIGNQVLFESNQVEDIVYTVSVQNSLTGCGYQEFVQVSVKPLPTVDAGIKLGHCPSDSIITNPTNSLNVETFQWSPSSFFSLAQESITLISVPSTQYVYLEVQSDFACKAIDSVLVEVFPIPNNLLVQQPLDVCFGDTASVNLPGSVIWQTSSNWTKETNTTWKFESVVNEVNSVFTAIDSNNCTADYPITTNHFPLPQPDNISVEDTICIEDEVEIQFIANNNYIQKEWTSLNGEVVQDFGNTVVLDPLVFPARLELFVTDEYKCDYRDTFTVYQHNVPQPNLNGQTEYCIGDTLEFNVDQSLPFAEWEFENNVENGPTFRFYDEEDGEISVIVLDDNGCLGYDTLSYIIRDLPIADAGQDRRGFVVQNFYLIGEGGVDYEWSGDGNILSPNSKITAVYFDMTDPLVEPFEQFGLQLKVTDEFGCIGYDSVNVVVEALDIDVVPSAFTPNGDGKSDKLVLVVREGFDVFEFRIWDRWGNEVYYTDTIVDWDGRDKNGQPVQQGVYVYRLLGLNEKGRNIEETGNITILR